MGPSAPPAPAEGQTMEKPHLGHRDDGAHHYQDQQTKDHNKVLKGICHGSKLRNLFSYHSEHPFDLLVSPTAAKAGDDDGN